MDRKQPLPPEKLDELESYRGEDVRIDALLDEVRWWREAVQRLNEFIDEGHGEYCQFCDYWKFQGGAHEPGCPYMESLFWPDGPNHPRHEK